MPCCAAFFKKSRKLHCKSGSRLDENDGDNECLGVVDDAIDGLFGSTLHKVM